ncbi:hypothetical protein ACFUGD_35285, partial [Streptomyces sp. NPDC057217]|uniref:hypothetical protein n=1 Tax=Streptomyces sp. NPDC057217 TaxID=3346054 RepID=UPI00362D664B
MRGFTHVPPITTRSRGRANGPGGSADRVRRPGRVDADVRVGIVGRPGQGGPGRRFVPVGEELEDGRLPHVRVRVREHRG